MNSIFNEDPTIIIEGRPLFSTMGEVPEEPYQVPIGQSALRREGNDATIVALGYMVPIAMRAAEQLYLDGINVDVIDLRAAAPMDKDSIFKSVAKTGRLVVADTAWQSFGVSAEISASVAEDIMDCLKSPVVRVALPDTHAPTSSALESLFYPGDEDVASAVRTVLR